MLALEHVLLVRTDRLGDMLLTLPMVDALRSDVPGCRVSVLASAANAEAARHHPDVAHVEVDALPAKGSGLRAVLPLARRIARLRCDAAVVAHPTPRLALALFLARVPVRVGTAYRAYSFLFNRRVREHRRHGAQKHESEYNVNLLRALGIAAPRPQPFRWRVSDAEARRVEERLAGRGVGTTRMVALHPGSAGSNLNWPPARYAELGRRLVGSGFTVAVTGGDHEAALVAAVVDGIGAGAVDLGAMFTLSELAAFYHRCALYVGGSTGPTHLAAAVGTPVLALYSPLRSGLPARWGPLGDRVHVFQPAVDQVCPSCLGERCPYYHCMDRHLGVDAVWRAARAVLDGGARA